MNVVVVTFSAGLITSLSLLSLSLAGIIVNTFQFWPPPDKASWQYKLFWLFFRLFMLTIVVLSVVDFQGLGQPDIWLSAIGWALSVSGFLIASVVSARLGWSNTHGEAVELRTDGLFAYSRNPIYVASVVGMAGLAIAISSSYVNWLLLIWATMYALAPFAEEPWLDEHYGVEYAEYCERVSRFI